MNEVYQGANAISDYLKPARQRYIPLVELPESLNPFLKSHDIHISIKLMNTLPLGNVKSVPAWNLLHSADVSGKHIVESSSGNTVFSMGLLAPHAGAKGVMAIASNDVTKDKLNLLRLANISVEMYDGPICPDPNDPNSTIAIAEEFGKRDDWYNPGQYTNDANPAAHEKVTGPQLYDQLGENIGLYVAGLGTTGTLYGTARYLKKQLPELRVGGVVRVPNNLVPGVRTRNGLREIAFDWKGIMTEETVMVNEHDSFAASLQLIRQGLLVGPSAGFAYKGLLTTLEHLQETGEIESLRGKHAVCIAPDSCFPYVDEYFEVLEGDMFPGIVDKTSGLPYVEADSTLANIPELSVDEVRADYIIKHDSLVKPAHYEVIDVRSPHEFTDHSLPGSINIPATEIPNWLKQADRSKNYLFVCRRIGLSARATQQAIDAGLSAYVMDGGTANWSAKGYERTLNGQCFPYQQNRSS